jgi:hypothetical protein
MAQKPGVEVEGLDVVRKNLRAVDKDLPKGLKAVHIEISKPIAEEARGRAPQRTGRLAASVRAGASQKSASVSAGGRLRPYPYGPVVHYGGYPGDYPGQPFLTETMADAAPGIADEYEDILFKWIESVWVDS